MTIPQEIRKKLYLKKGDWVTFIEFKGDIFIVPAEVIVSKAFDEFRNALDKQGMMPDNVIGQERTIRGNLIYHEFPGTGDLLPT